MDHFILDNLPRFSLAFVISIDGTTEYQKENVVQFLE